MAPTQRDNMFHVRMSDDERTMLEAVADREGLSASDKVRQLIRREYAAVFGEAPSPKRPKPKRK
jgi:hypothetical protein